MIKIIINIIIYNLKRKIIMDEEWYVKKMFLDNCCKCLELNSSKIKNTNEKTNRTKFQSEKVRKRIFVIIKKFKKITLNQQECTLVVYHYALSYFIPIS